MHLRAEDSVPVNFCCWASNSQNAKIGGIEELLRQLPLLILLLKEISYNDVGNQEFVQW